MTNELAIMVDDFITNKGIKKVYIANELNMTQQRLNDLFNKKNFTIDDANKVLNTIGYQVKFDIEPM